MASSNTRFLCCRGQALDVLSCYTSLWRIISDTAKVSMPSRAWVVTINEQVLLRKINVSMPSRAYTSFLQVICDDANDSCKREFQCPLGLIPHFYCWIPVWLHRKRTAVSMPSRAYTSVPLQKPRFYAVSRACFCRYLSEYSDSSCFSCMLTFWTYLMRCTYPWHWIKYSTNYNRCHPIFFTLLISWAEQ